MLVFGGSMGSSYNNNVYVLDITRRIWNMPSIPGPCLHLVMASPKSCWMRITLLLIGGCGGPSVMFSDVWLLDFDLCGDTEWKWTQLKSVNHCFWMSSNFLSDSPQDRRAVAAAFSNSVLNQANLINITSSEDQKSSHDNRPPPNSLQVTSNSSLLAHSANTASSGAPSKSSELHRACSIPAIIVGEIPKLIVTSSNDPQQNQQKVSLQL
uniref:Uncharacterized protein n=1 Tax=Ditylenchus dipsaci TaxID=166011 RepID=A0A915CTT2_9BILA